MMQTRKSQSGNLTTSIFLSKRRSDRLVVPPLRGPRPFSKPVLGSNALPFPRTRERLVVTIGEVSGIVIGGRKERLDGDEDRGVWIGIERDR